MASFETFHQVRVERDAQGELVRQATMSQPKFTVVGQKWVGLFVDGKPLFHVLQLWLCNEPDYRNVHSTARNVTIRLTFFAENDTRSLFALSSQWVEAIDPEAASFSGRSPYIDVPANDNPAKCNVLLRHWPMDADCYAHSFGKLLGTPDGRYKPFRLAPGRYRVNVVLKGDNIAQEIDLRLVTDDTTKPEFIGVPNMGDVVQRPVAADS